MNRPLRNQEAGPSSAGLQKDVMQATQDIVPEAAGNSLRQLLTDK